MVQQLLAAGADVHARGPNGFTALHRACFVWGNSLTARVLLDAGSDVNARDARGESPLDCSGPGGPLNTNTIALLVSRGGQRFHVDEPADD